jgi:uncharacterized membrane protein YraQ (UPF0718 family)
MSVIPAGGALPRRTGLFGLAAFVAIAVAALWWAKWAPYADRLRITDATGAYPGHDVLAKAGDPGAAPSWPGAWSFLKAYADAVWPALVAGLLIAAAVEALLPRRWLLRALGRDGARGRGAAAAASLPGMMCTCCTAPIVRSLRRSGVTPANATAYWLGNPVLNPAVIAFLAIVAPWSWVAVRVAVGLLVVLGLPALVARVTSRERTVAIDASDASHAPDAAAARRPVIVRYLRALARLALVLVPEYLVVVLLVGALRGWLLPIGDTATDLPVLITLAAAVLGALVVIPTGGEIPLLTGLAAAGVGAGPTGALLIALPAVSLPSIAMVARALGGRVTALIAGGVVACAVLAGALLWLLGG